jgi:hypothetical protein
LPTACQKAYPADVNEDWAFVDLKRKTLTARLPGDGSVTYRLGVFEGRVVVTGVVVKRPSGVTRALLRDRSPASAIERFLKLFADGLEVQRTDPSAIGLPVLVQEPAAATHIERDRRWRAVLDHLLLTATPWQAALDSALGRPAPTRNLRLARTAGLYVVALRAGSRTPNEDVARQLNRKTTHIRDDLKRARDAEILSPAPARGVPGGELTAKGESTLKENAS